MRLYRFSIPALFLAMVLVGVGCERPLQRPSVPFFPRVTEEVVQEQAVAYVDLTDGSAEIVRGDERVTAEDETELVAGDRVLATEGTVRIVYPETGASILQSGSEVLIVARADETGKIFAELQLLAGNVLTRFERLLGTDEHFSVEASGVVATVRGTSFSVSLGEDGWADIEVYDHKVEVATIEDSANPKKKASDKMWLAVDERFHGKKDEMQRIDPRKMRAVMVKRMTTDDKNNEMYRLGTKRIPMDRLRKPARKVRVNADAKMSEPMRARIEALWQVQMEAASGTVGF